MTQHLAYADIAPINLSRTVKKITSSISAGIHETEINRTCQSWWSVYWWKVLYWARFHLQDFSCWGAFWGNEWNSNFLQRQGWGWNHMCNAVLSSSRRSKGYASGVWLVLQVRTLVVFTFWTFMRILFFLFQLLAAFSAWSAFHLNFNKKAAVTVVFKQACFKNVFFPVILATE